MDKKYPYLIDRIQSVFIDLLLIISIMFLVSYLLEKFDQVPDWVRISLFVGIWIIYEPLFVSIGCTAGQYIKNLRVRRHGQNDRHINFFQSVLRYATKTFLGWISFLTINSNPEKRAIHDFASGSVMLKL